MIDDWKLTAILPAHDEQTLSFLDDLVMLHLNLRQDAEAEQQAEALIREYPDRAVGYASLANCFQRNRSPGTSDPARQRGEVWIDQS